jgi:hypothetical protein
MRDRMNRAPVADLGAWAPACEPAGASTRRSWPGSPPGTLPAILGPVFRLFLRLPLAHCLLRRQAQAQRRLLPRFARPSGRADFGSEFQARAAAPHEQTKGHEAKHPIAQITRSPPPERHPARSGCKGRNQQSANNKLA